MISLVSKRQWNFSWSSSSYSILEDDLEEIPKETDKDDAARKAKRTKRKEDDFLCRGHILNVLSTPVYNAHRTLETAKALWTALENKYRISKANNKKFLISNFMDFKMIANKSIIGQVSKILFWWINLKMFELISLNLLLLEL